MLKIKDNTVKSGYMNRWYKDSEKYIDDFVVKLEDCYDKYDIKYIIDNILEDEGYIVDFKNVVFMGAEEVIYYDFDDRYSIELYTGSENHTLNFVLKDFDSFDKLYELEYMKYLYSRIINRIKADLVEKVSD